MMHTYGYGNWERIRVEIRNAWQFNFDWFFKSRNASELGRRAEKMAEQLALAKAEAVEEATAMAQEQADAFIIQATELVTQAVSNAETATALISEEVAMATD